MAGGYFSDDENDKMKAVLYPYLMDKARRRAAQTSGQAYADRELGYRTDENNADARGLVSLLGDSASMAGTLEGKRSDVGMLPKYMDQLTANDQQRNENLFKERAAEEHSLGTDLNIAHFIGDMDNKDKDRKARAAAGEADRQAKLQAYLQAEKDKRDAAAESARRFDMTYNQRERLANKPKADNTAALDQRERFHNDAMALQREKMNRPEKAKEEKITDNERNAAMFYANSKNALGVLEEMEGRGYRPGGMTALKQKLTPSGLEGYTLSPDEQRYAQAAEDFTAAKLRLESGAAIPHSEIQQQSRIYMIQPGDSPEVIAQKQASRRQALEGLKFKAGPGAAKIGTAKKLVKQQRNKVTGQIKNIYDDGSEEIIGGK